ncbi:MAG: MBL fold metallo-hydrolase [Bdellovibrionales bacterium]|nr:MBL fold metallo-hydrolase [Bdellovibrionales bacterium]
MKITFLGATGTVTGSKYLINANGFKCLVDCGLFQGQKELRLRNWADFPISPKEIDAVVLTHAHIDHSGYLPVLKRHGFKGPIYSTSGTHDLCKILLPDAGKLQEEEARYADRKGYSKHKPALPLFTMEDAEDVLKLFTDVEFNREIDLSKELKLKFSPSGHILGSAFVTLKSQNTSVVFSGDLGRPNDLVMKPPAFLKSADYLLIESTYGDRTHPVQDPVDQLADVINRTVKRNGVVIIPAFSVGRSQSFLYAIHLLKSQKRIEDTPVFLNSPMSINTMGVYCDHQPEHKLDPKQCEAMCTVAKYVRTPEESKILNTKPGPMIIISASGMATGGRVVHHLKKFAPDARNTVLLAGYQAAGTRGEALFRGAKTIKIHGEQVVVNAEVACINGFSAHADQSEIMDWLKHFSDKPKMTFITHGEPASAKGLEEKIRHDLKWATRIPEYMEEVELV